MKNNLSRLFSPASSNVTNILCISHSAELSGATLSLLRVASYLAEKGHSITIIFPEEVHVFPSTIKLDNVRKTVLYNPELSWVETKGVKKKISLLWQRIKYVRQVRRFVKQGNFDLIYVNSAMALFGGLGAKSAGKKVVWHIREDLPLTPGNRLRIIIIKKIANSIIFVSRSIARAFGNKPTHQEWFFIPNPVEVSKFKVSDDEIATGRKELNIPDNTPVIINVGFISYRKGIDVLLRAFSLVIAEYPQVRLLIVGERARTTTDTYWNELQRIIKENNMEDSVVFTGFREDVHRLVGLSDIFVLSSRNEAMPVCVLEAMAGGKPIVATNVDAITDILDNGKLGIIVPPDNPDALATAIIELLQDETKRKNMGQLAQEKAITAYQPEKIYPEIESAILRYVHSSVGRLSRLSRLIGWSVKSAKSVSRFGVRG
ncbi:glycosyltransferase family 4 protein [Candidatus Sumerlaeota bacterium]|nr:glycosyltransferase family 4 protein [Candidatus Sumerlaeota bacterium]